MFVGENLLHTGIPLYIIADLKVNVESYLYKNNEPYWAVWYDAIKTFRSDYFIYLQEDFILYDDVWEERIFRYVDFLKDNPQYSFVRLLKATSFKDKKLYDTLYEVESSNKNVFAMQPTIWRSEDYLKLLDATREPKWLEPPSYRNQMIKMGMKGAYHYDGEEKVGKHHYDSCVYPYIATALVKGKWNMSEYGDELTPLFEKYDIDPNIRGTV